MMGSMSWENSCWFRRPVRQHSLSISADRILRGRGSVLTDEELGQRIFVNGPLLVANDGLEGSIYGLDVDASRDDLTCLYGFRVGRGSGYGDGLGREDRRGQKAPSRTGQVCWIDVGHDCDEAMLGRSR